MKNYVLLDVNLLSFDGEGGGESGTAGDGGVATTGTEKEKGVETEEESKVPKKEVKEKVIYGKVDEPKEAIKPDEKATKETVEKDGAKETEVDLSEKFEELIKGEYKDAFDKRTQGILDKRFKNSKQNESELGEMKPIIDLLKDKYGVKTVNELFEKVESDTIEDLAYKENLTPEQYKNKRELERKAKLYDATSMQEEERNILQTKVKGWYEQADKMKETYPDFNLQDWADNKEFLNLLHANIPVKQAYELLDLDNIKSNLASDVKANTVKDIQSHKGRPSEIATKSGKGVVVKSDVKSLTKADREEIAKRVRHGENISF